MNQGLQGHHKLNSSDSNRKWGLRRSGLRADIAAKVQRVGLLTHRGNAKADVLVERQAQLFGTFADVLAAHAFGEGFVFEAALHGVDLQIEDALRRSDVSTRREKSGELVASKKRVLQRRLARDSRIIGVGKDRADDFLRVAALAEFSRLPPDGQRRQRVRYWANARNQNREAAP